MPKAFEFIKQLAMFLISESASLISESVLLISESAFLISENVFLKSESGFSDFRKCTLRTIFVRPRIFRGGGSVGPPLNFPKLVLTRLGPDSPSVRRPFFASLLLSFCPSPNSIFSTQLNPGARHLRKSGARHCAQSSLPPQRSPCPDKGLTSPSPCIPTTITQQSPYTGDESGVGATIT